MWRFSEYVEFRDNSLHELWQRSAGLLGSKTSPGMTVPSQSWRLPGIRITAADRITLYRGLAGDFDPNYYSADQAWSYHLPTAYDYALKNAAAKNSVPTVVKTTLPGNLFDPEHMGLGNKPTDKAVVHPSIEGTIDIPQAVMRRLKIDVIPQQQLDSEFPDDAQYAYQLRQQAHRVAAGYAPNEPEEDWMLPMDDQ